MAETSTSDAAFIAAELGKKLAFASHALIQKAKADADLRVKRASKRLSLEERLKQAEAEVQSLRDENKQLNCKCSKLETTALDNEKVLESLRNTVENDTNEKSALKGRITELEAFHSDEDILHYYPLAKTQQKWAKSGPVVVARRPCEPLNNPTLLSLGRGNHLKRESHPSPIRLVFWGDWAFS